MSEKIHKTFTCDVCEKEESYNRDVYFPNHWTKAKMETTNGRCFEDEIHICGECYEDRPKRKQHAVNVFKFWKWGKGEQ